MKKITLLLTLSFILASGVISAQVSCSLVAPSNNFQSGQNCTRAANRKVANDFTVADGENATLTDIVVNLIVGTSGSGVNASFVDLYVYADAGGTPGAVISTQLGLIPTSQTVIGAQFGDDVWAVAIDVADVALPGASGSTTSYWIGISVEASNGTSQVFWEYSTAAVIGFPEANDFQSPGNYIITAGREGVYTFNAVCAAIFIPNDECADATAVACDETVVGTTADNTDTGGVNDSLDEWYSFTGTAGEITVSLCDGSTDYDSQLTIYDACGGTLIANNNDFCGLQSELTFTSDGTTTYYIAVEGFSSSEAGNFSLTISCEILGIGDNVIEGFSYAPNPVDNVLNLNSVEIIKEIQIFNILGQKVIDMQVDAINLQIDLSELQTGAYIMKVLVNGKTGTYKVVKK